MRHASALSRRLVLAGLVALGLGFAPPADAASFRLASIAPQDSSWGKLIQQLAEAVKKETGGKVEFKLYLSGKMGDEAKVVKKLGRGLDGAFFTGQGMGLVLPAFRVQELPFLSETYAEADKVRGALWPMFEAGFEKDTDFVLLGPGETGMVYLFSKQPIDSVEKLRAASLWVWEGDNVAAETFKIFDVSPRPLDLLTVVQQLKGGGIDTVYNSPAGAVALGWTGDLSHVTGRAFAYASGGFLLTKQAWAKIPADQQPVVKRLVAEFGEKIVKQARSDNEATLARLTSAGGGMSKTAIDDAKYAEMRKIAVANWAKLAGSLSAGAYLDAAKKTLGK
jgi:TRAP-type C4-dicarboxylate transport system substrate-binding protein